MVLSQQSTSLLGFLCFLLHATTLEGFLISPMGGSSLVARPNAAPIRFSPLRMSGNDETPKRRRRRKRKEEAVDADAPAEAAPSTELKPRDDNPDQAKSMNIRESTDTSSAVPSKESISGSIESSAAPTSVSVGSATTPSVDDSLQQLLEDAKRMQEQDKSAVEERGNTKANIRNILGTIVTADFFVVCGFLLWFLAGIFCSSVLKDDTVQIAFNSNFQAFVQPSLGILMIGAIAGNFFQDEEEEI